MPNLANATYLQAQKSHQARTFCRFFYLNVLPINQLISNQQKADSENQVYNEFRYVLPLRLKTGERSIPMHIYHCLNKRERPLHSERTSILHGWLLRFCQNIVTRFDRTSRLLVWLYLIVFDQFNYKISGNAVETTDNSR